MTCDLMQDVLRRVITSRQFRCDSFVTCAYVATELARSDYPTEHILHEITCHRGSLLGRATLQFYAVFMDGDAMWLPWAEVSATAALDRHAQQYASTRLLLSGTAQE
jgi:hypothetical protein